MDGARKRDIRRRRRRRRDPAQASARTFSLVHSSCSFHGVSPNLPAPCTIPLPHTTHRIKVYCASACSHASHPSSAGQARHTSGGFRHYGIILWRAFQLPPLRLWRFRQAFSISGGGRLDCTVQAALSPIAHLEPLCSLCRPPACWTCGRPMSACCTIKLLTQTIKGGVSSPGS